MKWKYGNKNKILRNGDGNEILRQKRKWNSFFRRNGHGNKISISDYIEISVLWVFCMINLAKSIYNLIKMNRLSNPSLLPITPRNCDRVGLSSLLELLEFSA
jgi:hypothetical protein